MEWKGLGLFLGKNYNFFLGTLLDAEVALGACAKSPKRAVPGGGGLWLPGQDRAAGRLQRQPNRLIRWPGLSANATTCAPCLRFRGTDSGKNGGNPEWLVVILPFSSFDRSISHPFTRRRVNSTRHRASLWKLLGRARIRLQENS